MRVEGNNRSLYETKIRNAINVSTVNVDTGYFYHK